jgi:hypothetical protein
LDWNVENINDQDETTLNNTYTSIKENWEYCGFKGEPKVLRYIVFENNLCQQLKNKRYQIKMCILKTIVYLSESLVEYGGSDPKKIEQANVMQEVRKHIKKYITL